MQDIGATMLLAGALILGGTMAWFWIADQYRKANRLADGVNRCLCGREDLADITAQHRPDMIHERSRCFPRREFIPQVTR